MSTDDDAVARVHAAEEVDLWNAQQAAAVMRRRGFVAVLLAPVAGAVGIGLGARLDVFALIVVGGFAALGFAFLGALWFAIGIAQHIRAGRSRRSLADRRIPQARLLKDKA